MLHVRKSEPPPDFDAQAKSETAAARAFYAQPPKRRHQKRFEFKVYRQPEVKAALRALFSGKCAYCEQPTDESLAQVDHFRPKWGAMWGKRIWPDLYWWLGASWANLYYCCSDCNDVKGTRFPIQDERRRAGREGGETIERPLFLDPCVDRPQDHLVFADNGKVSAALDIEGRPSPRAQATIDGLNLNRPTLVDARRKRMKALLPLLRTFGRQHVMEALSEQASTDLHYAGAVRRRISEWMTTLDRAALTELLSSDGFRTVWDERPRAIEDWNIADQPKQETFVTQSLRILRVEIENFRGIRSLKMDFGRRDGHAFPWLLLLGENGCGKSSFLEAVGLTLAGSDYVKTLDLKGRDLIHRTPVTDKLGRPRKAVRGSVRVHHSGSEKPLEMRFRADEDAIHHSTARVELPVLAYGATRLLPRSGHVAERERKGPARLRNLFDPFIPLRNPKHWLMDKENLKEIEFGNVAVAIRKLIPDAPEDWLRRDRDEPEVAWPTPEVPALRSTHRRRTKTTDSRRYSRRKKAETRFSLTELSAGYQTVLALALDIYQSLRRYFPAMELAEGVVLLDEIGEHLHPRWKKRILGDLRRVFPRVQIVATTHDPLCLRGVKNGEVALLRKTPQGEVFATRDLPDVEGMRVDQILLSEHFSLGSLFDDEIEETFRRYYELLAKADPTPIERLEIEEKREKVDSLNVLGSGQRERLALEAIDRYIAGDRATADVDDRKALKAKMRAELDRIWKQLDLVPGGKA